MTFWAIWQELGLTIIPKPKSLVKGDYKQDKWAEQTPPPKTWKGSMPSEPAGFRYTTKAAAISKGEANDTGGQPEIPKQLRENSFLQEVEPQAADNWPPTAPSVQQRPRPQNLVERV